MQITRLIPLLAVLTLVSGCLTDDPPDSQSDAATPLPGTNAPAAPAIEPDPQPPAPGTMVPRLGDEIVVAGRFVHTGNPVVLWMDPGGYDAYRVERRFGPANQSSWLAMQESGEDIGSPNRYDERTARLNDEERERIRGGGWDLPLLQQTIDQVVLHYDAAGTSRQCFKVLHDLRDLSVHFMVDLDGTIYQTLDVKERARHASGANDRSIGIEIANIGAYPTNAAVTLSDWYQADTNGQVGITLPARFGNGGLRITNFVARPARPGAITNTVQGELLVQYDYTPEQYTALSHLVAALCTALPEIQCQVPRDSEGNVPAQKLSDEALASFKGVLGHYHITERKIDPGPAFDWEKLMAEARTMMNRGGVESAPTH